MDSSPDRCRPLRRTTEAQGCSSCLLRTVWPTYMIRCTACVSTYPRYSRKPRTWGNLRRSRCFHCTAWCKLFPYMRKAHTPCSKRNDTSPPHRTFARSSQFPPCRWRWRIPCHLATDDSPRCRHMFHLAHMCLPNPVCRYPSDPPLRGPESSTQHCPSSCRWYTCSCKPSHSRRHPHKSHARIGWPACMPGRHRTCLRRPALETSYPPRTNHLARRRVRRALRPRQRHRPCRPVERLPEHRRHLGPLNQLDLQDCRPRRCQHCSLRQLWCPQPGQEIQPLRCLLATAADLSRRCIRLGMRARMRRGMIPSA